MTLVAPPVDSDTGRPFDVLEGARDRVAGRIEATASGAGETLLEWLGELDAIVARLRAVSAGGPDAAPAPMEVRAIHNHLVAEIRAELLAAPVEDASTARQLLAFVRALENLLPAPHGEHDLRTRLAQPDALELLVEVAHDLRSPLTSILFLSETLRVGYSGPVNDLQKSQLGLIYSAALGLVSIATDVVDLAREGKGLVEGDPKPFFLAEVFEHVTDMVQPMAEEKGVELRVKVPEYERPHGYPVALGRVLLNLTTNALKFTDDGYVEIGAERRSRATVECYVRDTGRGISETQQEALYQPWKPRLNGEGQFFSGSGVGLSIARRLVRSMGSELRFETASGWGTRFYFHLPDSVLR